MPVTAITNAHQPTRICKFFTFKRGVSKWHLNCKIHAFANKTTFEKCRYTNGGQSHKLIKIRRAIQRAGDVQCEYVYICSETQLSSKNE